MKVAQTLTTGYVALMHKIFPPPAAPPPTVTFDQHVWPLYYKHCGFCGSIFLSEIREGVTCVRCAQPVSEAEPRTMRGRDWPGPVQRHGRHRRLDKNTAGE